MSSPAEYPMPSVSASNPKPSAFYKMPDIYNVTTSLYDDRGKDFALQNGGVGEMNWTIEYATLNTAEAAILDAHVASAQYNDQEGSAFGFNFRDRDTGTLYTNVHYAPGGFVRPAHKNRYIQSRTVMLVRYP